MLCWDLVTPPPLKITDAKLKTNAKTKGPKYWEASAALGEHEFLFCQEEAGGRPPLKLVSYEEPARLQPLANK